MVIVTREESEDQSSSDLPKAIQSHGPTFKPGSASLKACSFHKHFLRANSKPVAGFLPHRVGS